MCPRSASRSGLTFCGPTDQLTKLLCPLNFSGQNTRVGCRFLLQGIFPTQGRNPHLLCLLPFSKWILYRLGSLKVDLFFLPSVGKANIIQSTEGLNRTKGWRKEKLSLSLPQAGLDIILLLPLDCDFHHWHSLLSGLSAQAEIYAVGFPGFSACRLWVVGFLSLQITQANSS